MSSVQRVKELQYQLLCGKTVTSDDLLFLDCVVDELEATGNKIVALHALLLASYETERTLCRLGVVSRSIKYDSKESVLMSSAVMAGVHLLSKSPILQEYIGNILDSGKSGVCGIRGNIAFTIVKAARQRQKWAILLGLKHQDHADPNVRLHLKEIPSLN